MCLKYVLECFLCKKRSELPKEGAPLPRGLSEKAANKIVLEEKKCGYWFCEFENNKRECRDQFCEQAKCRLTVIPESCQSCFEDDYSWTRIKGACKQNIFFRKISNAPAAPPPLGASLYTPPLSKKECLFKLISYLSFEDCGQIVRGADRILDEDPDYLFLLLGCSKHQRVTFTVIVIRKSGEVNPLSFEASCGALLALTYYRSPKKGLSSNRKGFYVSNADSIEWFDDDDDNDDDDDDDTLKNTNRRKLVKHFLNR